MHRLTVETRWGFLGEMTILELIAAKKAAAKPQAAAPPAAHHDPMLEAAINRIDPPSLGKRRAAAVDALGLPDRADRGGAVLNISERLAANARKLREVNCPPDHCDHCYRYACRLLLIGCCICTGGVNLSKKNFFPTTP